MIPRTFPSTYASNGQQQMLVHFLTDVTGLQRWSDYIPVKLAQTGTENSYANDGYIDVKVLSPLTASTQAWKEYIPVYVDDEATDTWTVNATGYIPYGYALFGDASMQLDFTSGKQALDPRITFTRASTATYFNSAGVLTTTGFNLLTYSEQFDDAAWTKTRSSITADAAVSPDGTMDADKLVEDTTASATHQIQRSISYTSGTTYTRSLYAKAAERTGFRFQFPSSAFTSGLNAYFDLDTGTVASVSAGVTATITPVGNGWYRCTATATATATASGTEISCGLTITAVNPTYTGDGTSGLYIWGAQLEAGSAATVYIPTTSATSGAARFDYDPVTLAPKGLLIEESRTNLLLYSTDLSTGWTKGTAATWTANAATAPDGTMTALQGNGVSGFNISGAGSAVYRLGNTVSGSTAYTFSVYVRTQTGTATNVRLRLNETGGNNTLSSDLTVTTAWTRLSLTVTTAAGATAISTLVGTGSGTADLYIWGAQLEAGAFATSYIPTVASQVTRAADVAVMQGANFSNWYNAVEGTLYADASPQVSNAGGSVLFEVNDATASNRIGLSKLVTTGNASMFVLVGGATQVSTNNGAWTSSGKLAGAYAVNDFASVLNGGAASTDTSGTLPVVTQATIGARGDGAARLNGTIKRLAYFPRRLSDAELQGITS